MNALSRGSKRRSGLSTIGHKHDLLALDQGAGYAPIQIVIGDALSDVGVVAAAVKDFEVPAPGGGGRSTVAAKSWASGDAMIEKFRAMRSDAGRVPFAIHRCGDRIHLWVATWLRARRTAPKPFTPIMPAAE